MTPALSEHRTAATKAAVRLAAVLLVAGALALLHRSSSKSGLSTRHGQVIPMEKRSPAGPLSGSLLSGGSYQLRDDLGSVALLNFFASWCPPCQIETPQLDALYRQRAGAGVRFVGLDVKDGSQDGSRSWLADKNITFPVVWDQPGKTAIELGHTMAWGLPNTVLIDKHARIAAVYVGAVLPADISPALDTLVAEP